MLDSRDRGRDSDENEKAKQVLRRESDESKENGKQKETAARTR